MTLETTTVTRNSRHLPERGDDDLRAGAYSLFGRLLAAPADGELLQQLADLELLQEEMERDLAAAWSMLKLAAERATPDSVEEEYSLLFIGLGRGELVPFGSWYQTGFLMERPLAQLRRDLQALGFERQPDVKEPEDHGGALLEVMAYLVAGGEPEQQQQAFFNAHVGNWMGRFFDDLREAESARFYRAVGELGGRFIRNEQRWFAMEV